MLHSNSWKQEGKASTICPASSPQTTSNCSKHHSSETTASDPASEKAVGRFLAHAWEQNTEIGWGGNLPGFGEHHGIRKINIFKILGPSLNYTFQAVSLVLSQCLIITSFPCTSTTSSFYRFIGRFPVLRTAEPAIFTFSTAYLFTEPRLGALKSMPEQT